MRWGDRRYYFPNFPSGIRASARPAQQFTVSLTLYYYAMIISY